MRSQSARQAHVRWVLEPGRQFISKATKAPAGKSGQAKSKNPSDILINPTTQAKTRSHSIIPVGNRFLSLHRPMPSSRTRPHNVFAGGTNDPILEVPISLTIG